ncbi:hypothetical protein INR49_015017 [Caranx melampygus]|nr:hypothetical protein INR49_015017 [Caranx melampygus]
MRDEGSVGALRATTSMSCATSVGKVLSVFEHRRRVLRPMNLFSRNGLSVIEGPAAPQEGSAPLLRDLGQEAKGVTTMGIRESCDGPTVLVKETGLSPQERWMGWEISAKGVKGSHEHSSSIIQQDGDLTFGTGLALMFSLSAPSALPSLVPKRPYGGPSGGNFPLRVAGTSSHEHPLQSDGLSRRFVLQQCHLDDRSEGRPLGLQARLAQHHLQGRHEQPRPEPGQAPLRDGHGLGCSGGARPHMVDFKAGKHHG